MQVQRLITNETCNQNCWFCNGRRPAERADFIARAAVRQRIEEARAGGPREIVLSGGEPTLRSDLTDLVRRCAEGGVRTVLETNAALIDDTRAQALAAAGLDTARVQLLAWGAVSDEISREPGGFAAALRGLRALDAAGVRVEVTTPIVRRNAAAVGQLPRAIKENGLPVSSLTLVVPTSAPDPDECATVPQLAAAVRTIADEARRVGLMVRLDPSTYLPPCLFDPPERVAHLFALNRGNASRTEFSKVRDCEACLVRDRCPGVPRALLVREPQPRLQPVASDRLRRRLTVVSSIEDQIARELITHGEYRVGDRALAEETIRINFHCNQACEFCFVSTHLPPAAEAAVRTAIETASREGAIVVLSGGEPTLNPRLAEYVALARREGAAAVELQSNATRLGDAVLVDALVAAGLDRAMISLHGATAAVSDAITGAPGTFEATLRGLDQLARTDIELRLNFVFCQANRDQFPAMVDLVASRWPKAAIVFSFVGSHTDVVPRSESLIPRFRDVLPALTEGLARARQAGLRVTGFDSMCGLPLCLVPESERGELAAVAVSDDTGGGEFVKTEACAGCREQHRCFGVRRGYAEIHGTGELHPL